eukprot:GHVU01213449.1.p1 GENE.GHVU01213449.1~~GHVU01213449.1.p1  ORF type:complete len:289 (+),score=36.36 GHVU01213449.1:38-868(+)
MAEAAADKCIDTGQYYDAHQRVLSLINRAKLTKRRHLGELERIVTKYANKFADCGRSELVAELCVKWVQDMIDSRVKAEDEAKFLILEILGKIPTARDHANLLNLVLKWSASNECPKGDLMFHEAAGWWAVEDKKFGKAQTHLVYCSNASSLYELVKAWQDDVYPSESALLVLRLCLMLLGRNEVHICASFMEMVEQDFSGDAIPPPPIQAAVFFCEACKELNHTFFTATHRKYNLVLRRDPCFEQLIATIEASVFNVKKRQGQGMFDTIRSIIGM